MMQMPGMMLDDSLQIQTLDHSFACPFCGEPEG